MVTVTCNITQIVFWDEIAENIVDKGSGMTCMLDNEYMVRITRQMNPKIHLLVYVHYDPLNKYQNH